MAGRLWIAALLVFLSGCDWILWEATVPHHKSVPEGTVLVCREEGAPGGFSRPALGGPTNPNNPYADAVKPGEGLPCATVGFDDNEVYCRFFEQCVIGCRAASDCPAMAGARAPDCRVSKLAKSCVLPCVGTSECPSGMNCVTTTFGFGQVCMWGAGPTHYRSP